MSANALLDSTIDVCVRSGIDALKRAKFAWWPTEGQADFAEDNLWFHVGWALQNAGFHVYAKAQVAGVPQQHVDAVALHREYRCAIVVEAKRLYQSDNYASLGNDWLRLQRIKLTCEWLSLPQPLACYALLLGSCWSQNYMQWWKDPMREAAPVGARSGESWQNLQAALNDAVRVDAIDVQLTGWNPHWICYSLIPLPDDHWCGASNGSIVTVDAGI